MTSEQLANAARKVVASAPPLTDTQRDALQRAFGARQLRPKSTEGRQPPSIRTAGGTR